jgi:hypothetical protein
MHAKPTRTRHRESLSKSKSRSAIRKASQIESLEGRLYLTAAVYNWQNASIGAGGFVDGIFYDPHNQNTLYARTDIGGLYKSTNDGANWTQLLDFVGNSSASSGNGTQAQEIGVLSFAIDPENSNNLYADVGEYSGTNGNVLYSTNGGATWSTTALSFYVGGNSNGRGDGEQIAVDPNDSNIVFLGTNDHGLWESTNAGHSFTRISTSVFSPTSTTFVLFNPTGTAGNPSQTIYVGINSTSTGTNLYQTSNGGTSWAQITGTGTLPTGYLPGHGVISNGYIYLGYANAEAPNGSITNGGIYRYQISTGAWANISPVATAGKFGYDAVAADPSNPNTVVATSFDDYSGPDQMWRTVNANAATPTWTEVFDFSNSVQDNFGYGGYNTTRNASTAGYAELSGDGISNWAATVAINPFNSNQLMYGTGQGIWATNNISNSGTNTQLTAANSWYFPDAGIEFTAVGGLATASQGVPLFSAMGDIFGFAHTSLTSTPAQYDAAPLGSANGVDAAGNVVAIVGSPDSSSGTFYGVYSTNDGLTFNYFPTSPGTGNTYGTDTVAVSANGATIVWSQSGLAPYYSTNDGTTWTASSGGMAVNGQVIADRVNASDFYYRVGTNVYFSNNGGVSFTLESSSAPSGGQMAANPFVAGDLWIAASGGLYHSSNFGASFTKVSSALTSTNGVLALGAPAPGQTTPAIYVFGTVSSFLGIYRSDDGGSTWLQLNNTSQQWGGLIQTMAADPNSFGRVYIGINGRGVIMGNPTTSLPANWIDTDIGSPGNPGWATSSATLSNGTTVTNWNVNGGGQALTGATYTISSLTYNRNTSTGAFAVTAVTSAPNGLTVGDAITIAGASPSGFDGTFQISGIVNSTTFTYQDVPSSATATLVTGSGSMTASTTDQLNFVYEPMTGNVTVSAKLLSLTNADGGNGTPEAGIMIRNGTGPTDPFVALMQTSSGTLLFEDRSNGSLNTQTVTGIPVGAEYLEIVAANQGYTAYYSSNGTSWTQLGIGVTVPTSGSLSVGLAATASYNPQLTSATFSNVNVAPTATGPTIVNPAAANPNPVTGASTALSALGSENGSGSGLTYTWAYTGPTGVTYTSTTNGTNAAQNITANFTHPGTYNFTVTITDASSQSIQSPISVTVNQTPTNVSVSPSTTTTIPVTTSQGYTVSVTDQFGNAMSTSGVTWSITGASNSISNIGNATLGSTPGSFTVTATDGSAEGTSTLIGENFAVPSGSTLDINLGSAGPVALTETAGTITASQNGVQISITGMTTLAVTDTASGDELDINSAISEPFTVSGADSATLDVNTGAITFAAVQGGSINLGALSIATGASAAITPTTSQQPTTLNVTSLAVSGTGQLDVANNVVVISYGNNPDPITTIADLLASGFNGGLWNGAGIISTTAQTQTKYALGYADSADPGDPANLSVHTIEIKYTLQGDADLNGTVNGVDFGIVSANFNRSVTAWDQGDFNYDGIVNGVDFGEISVNFNQGANIAATVVASGPTLPTGSQADPLTTTPTTPPVTQTPLIVKKLKHRIR